MIQVDGERKINILLKVKGLKQSHRKCLTVFVIIKPKNNNKKQ